MKKSNNKFVAFAKNDYICGVKSHFLSKKFSQEKKKLNGIKHLRKMLFINNSINQ